MEGPAHQALAAPDRDGRAGPSDLSAKCLEGALRMIARRHRLDDARHPVGMESSEQHRALDLRARDIGHEIDGLQAIRSFDGQRRPAFV